MVLGELTSLKLTFNLPPAATVEELALTLAVVVVVLVTVIEDEVAIVVNVLFLLSRSSYTPGVVGKVTDTVPELKAVEPGL